MSIEKGLDKMEADIDRVIDIIDKYNVNMDKFAMPSGRAAATLNSVTSAIIDNPEVKMLTLAIMMASNVDGLEGSVLSLGDLGRRILAGDEDLKNNIRATREMLANAVAALDRLVEPPSDPKPN